MAQLAVQLPDDMVQAMHAAAASRGITTDALVEEAFRHVHNRTDPARHIQ